MRGGGEETEGGEATKEASEVAHRSQVRGGEGADLVRGYGRWDG